MIALENSTQQQTMGSRQEVEYIKRTYGDQISDGTTPVGALAALVFANSQTILRDRTRREELLFISQAQDTLPWQTAADLAARQLINQGTKIEVKAKPLIQESPARPEFAGLPPAPMPVFNFSPHQAPNPEQPSSLIFLQQEVRESFNAIDQAIEATRRIATDGFSFQKKPNGFPTLGNGWFGSPSAVWTQAGLSVHLDTEGNNRSRLIPHQNIADGTAKISVDNNIFPPWTVKGANLIIAGAKKIIGDRASDWHFEPMATLVVEDPLIKNVAYTLHGVPNPFSTAAEILTTAHTITKGETAKQTVRHLLSVNPVVADQLITPDLLSKYLTNLT